MTDAVLDLFGFSCVLSFPPSFAFHPVVWVWQEAWLAAQDSAPVPDNSTPRSAVLRRPHVFVVCASLLVRPRVLGVQSENSPNQTPFGASLLPFVTTSVSPSTNVLLKSLKSHFGSKKPKPSQNRNLVSSPARHSCLFPGQLRWLLSGSDFCSILHDKAGEILVLFLFLTNPIKMPKWLGQNLRYVGTTFG